MRAQGKMEHHPKFVRLVLNSAHSISFLLPMEQITSDTAWCLRVSGLRATWPGRFSAWSPKGPNQPPTFLSGSSAEASTVKLIPVVAGFHFCDSRTEVPGPSTADGQGVLLSFQGTRIPARVPVSKPAAASWRPPLPVFCLASRSVPSALCFTPLPNPVAPGGEASLLLRAPVVRLGWAHAETQRPLPTVTFQQKLGGCRNESPAHRTLGEPLQFHLQYSLLLRMKILH